MRDVSMCLYLCIYVCLYDCALYVSFLDGSLFLSVFTRGKGSIVESITK